jgi:DNA repair photolyase
MHAITQSPTTARRAPLPRAPEGASTGALARRALPEGGFGWAIDPFRGCELGCSHCPARLDAASTAEVFSAFTRVEPRTAAVGVLLAHLADAARRQDGSFGEHPVLLGTSCDPWQPAEREALLTRRILETLAPMKGLSLRARTRSSLIGRDVDLLAEVARRGDVRISVALPTIDRRTWMAMEPDAPSPERRLMTVGLLARAGLNVGVEVGPVLKGVADSDEAWTRLLTRARAAGARFAELHPLQLSEGARERLISLGSEAEPARGPALKRLYARTHLHDAHSIADAQARFAQLAQRVGLTATAVAARRAELGGRGKPVQLSLF